MKIERGSFVVVRADIERGNNVSGQFNSSGGKLNILKLHKGITGVIVELDARPGWMTKANVLLETGQNFWLWEDEFSTL